MRCVVVMSVMVFQMCAAGAAHGQPPTTAPRATAPPATAPVAAAPLTAADWREDLQSLTEAVAGKHKNAFTKTSREDFEAAAKDVDSRLDTLTNWQRYIEFKRLVAMVGDAHTTVDDSKGLLPRRYYPFSVLLLKDGVCVTATTPELQALLGRRITRIGSTDIDDAIERLGTIIPHENPAWLRNQARVWINSPEALQALGLIADMDHAKFTFVDAAGTETEMTLTPMIKGQSQSAAPELKPDRLPATLRPRAGNAIYGCTMLPDSRDLYVWYDSCSNMKDISVAQFAHETLAIIDRDQPKRVIVDLRRNGGGNSALIQPLIAGLVERKDRDGAPALFALIGANTFSSGLWAAENFKRIGATLVGTPTGGRPNSFGEIRSVQLPHSGLTLYYSTKLWTRDPDSDPDSLEPAVFAEPTYVDLIAGKDVTIDAVRAQSQ